MYSRKRQLLENAIRPVIAKWFKDYRTNKGLSQEAFSRLLYMSVRSYSDLEHGIYMPSGETLALFLWLLDKGEMERFLAEVKRAIG